MFLFSVGLGLLLLCSVISFDIQENRVLVCIAAFRSMENPYLLRALEQYQLACEVGYIIKVVIQTVDRWTPEQLEIMTQSFKCIRQPTELQISIEIYEDWIGMDLTEKHRTTMQPHIDAFDLFIFQEDDIIITRDHISLFFRSTSAIETRYEASANASTVPVVGLIRYEEFDEPITYTSSEVGTVSHPAGSKFLFEIPFTNFLIDCVGDTPVFKDFINPHQASWMLTNSQLKRMVRDCDFLSQGSIILPNPKSKMVFMSTFSLFAADTRVLELLKLSPNLSCNVPKVIPAVDFCRYGVHHSRQKYADIAPIFTIDDVITSGIAMATDETARRLGDVPMCWQNAVDNGMLHTCQP